MICGHKFWTPQLVEGRISSLGYLQREATVAAQPRTRFGLATRKLPGRPLSGTEVPILGTPPVLGDPSSMACQPRRTCSIGELPWPRDARSVEKPLKRHITSCGPVSPLVGYGTWCSQRVWNMALSAQFSPTQPIASLHELLDHLTSCFQRRHTPLTHQRDCAHMVCATVAGLWMERNRRLFKEDHSPVEPETLYQEIVSMC